MQNRKQKRSTTRSRNPVRTKKPAWIYLLALLLVLPAPALVATETTNAENAEDGTNDSQLEELLERLESEDLPQEERFSLTEQVSERASTVREALDVIDAQSSKLTGVHRAHAYGLKGDLLSLVADLERAADAYADAASTAEKTADRRGKRAAWGYRLEEARLRLEIGDNESAAELGRTLVASAEDPAVQRQAALVEARATAAMGRPEEAFERARQLAEAGHTPTLRPETLLFLQRSARRLGNTEAEARAKELLQELYPDSPEALMTKDSGTVREFPRPSAYLGFGGLVPTSRPAGASPVDAPTTEATAQTAGEPGSEQTDSAPGDATAPAGPAETQGPTGIQVGSFSNPENAEDMRSEIDRAGFDARIADSPEGEFHRVIIPVGEPSEAQQTILELKEKGFEGFLVFEEDE